jgi:hypothetical protein
MIFHGLIVVIVLVLLCVPSIASADGLTWNLSGVTFGDGGTASGSFVYDATTNTVSNIDIVTTKGTLFGGTTYLGVDPGFAPFALAPQAFDLVLVPNPSLSSFTGTFLLDLSFPNALTNSGGTVSMAGMGSEDLCAPPSPEFPLDNCAAAQDTPFRMMTAGDVVSASVATPEPSALLLLGMGLVGFVGAAKRKVQA